MPIQQKPLAASVTQQAGAWRRKPLATLSAAMLLTLPMVGCEPSPELLFDPQSGAELPTSPGSVSLQGFVLSSVVCYTTDGSLPSISLGSCAGETTNQLAGPVVTHPVILKCGDDVGPQVSRTINVAYDWQDSENPGQTTTLTASSEYFIDCSVDPIDDADNDGVADEVDNCPDTPNAEQIDLNDNGIGDACEDLLDDTDSDGVLDADDNCPTEPNGEQTDTDNDGIGDACEPDSDDDGVIDDVDNCVDVPNGDQDDIDDDGLGDACDASDDTDSDNDGYANYEDNCPLVANADQTDDDDDGIGNACEPDSDNDGVIDDVDNCPTTSNLNQADSNNNGIGDACDQADQDNDGIYDVSDNCPTVANANQFDTDGDGIGDACDDPWYTIKHKQSGECIVVSGTDVRTEGCDSTNTRQQWTLSAAGSGFLMESVDTGTCMVRSGTDIQVTACNAGSSTQQMVLSGSGDSQEISPASSNGCFWTTISGADVTASLGNCGLGSSIKWGFYEEGTTLIDF